jgi:hypothetical protein
MLSVLRTALQVKFAIGQELHHVLVAALRQEIRRCFSCGIDPIFATLTRLFHSIMTGQFIGGQFEASPMLRRKS